MPDPIGPRLPPPLALKAAGSALLPVVAVGVGVAAVSGVVGLVWFLLGSSGLAGSGVALALERTLFTLAGVGLAAVVALALDVVDRRAAPALGAD